MTYWALFISFVKVGFLGFGGGMAIISLIQDEVLRHGWATETEFMDIVAISQVTPGPIGINCATYVGYTATDSVWGSLLASFAIILPSLIIMLTICYLYDKIEARWQENKVFQTIMRIIRILVVLLIAHAAYTMISPASFIDAASWIIFGCVVLCMISPEIARLIPACRTDKQDSFFSCSLSPTIKRTTDLISHPILLILLAGLTGYLLYA